MAPTQPTLEMVAAAAGVSRSTVSRVVNRSPSVSPAVEVAVQAAIEQLRYVPNRAARSLAGSHTYAIALLVPESANYFFGDPYLASIVQGIAASLDETDYILNLLMAGGGPAGKAERYLHSGNVDGALVISHHTGDLELAELNATLPLVFGGRPDIVGLDHFFGVDVDNVLGGAQATRHLVASGRRRIATISGPLDMKAAVDRLLGWRQVLVEAGLPTDAVATADFTDGGGAAAMRELLTRFPDLDAVFVASDLMARAAVSTLSERGYRVPQDVAVVGYDNSSAATAGELALTTVHQPSAAMGGAMAAMLVDLLEGTEPEAPVRLMDTYLVLRDTA